MSARTRLLVVSEPEERLWPLPLAATAPLEYGDERTAGDEAVRRREGILDEDSRLTQCLRMVEMGGHEGSEKKWIWFIYFWV